MFECIALLSKTMIEFPPHSPLLGLPGAVAEGPTAWHYGNPLGEQRNFSTGALVDRSDRRVIKLTGSDARTYANTLLSQKLDDAPTGFCAQALNLDAQGRIVHILDVLVDQESVLLDVEPAGFDSLFDYLKKMVFWFEVTVSVEKLGLLSVIGCETSIPYLSRKLGGRKDYFVPWDELFDAANQLIAQGAKPTGAMAYTARRVQALAPEPSLDLDAKAIAHEIPHLINRDEVAAVHLDKGCYRGQETVARVENLGRAPRLLVMLQLDGSAPELPTPGTPITSGTRTVGRLGTVVHDADYGPIALGLIKRSALTAKQLTAGDAALLVDVIPTESQLKAGRLAIDRLKGHGDPS